MARYLSQDWLDMQRSLAADQPDRPGASARIQHVVSGAPDGDVDYYWVVEDGHLIDSGLGVLDATEITLTMKYGDAREMHSGRLDPSAAFMQGRLKAAGDMGKFLALMPVTTSPEYRELSRALAAATEF